MKHLIVVLFTLAIISCGTVPPKDEAPPVQRKPFSTSEFRQCHDACKAEFVQQYGEGYTLDKFCVNYCVDKLRREREESYGKEILKAAF